MIHDPSVIQDDKFGFDYFEQVSGSDSQSEA